VVGQSELDELLAQREKVNQRLQEIIDEQTEPWGIKVSVVEVRDVEIPATMQRAMARQAEAERERRAKVIHAEGEFQAAERLADAARVISTQPAALQLRYLSTLTELATERTSTVVFPLPIDILSAFAGRLMPVPSGSGDTPPGKKEEPPTPEG
jgi:regulator of protease activity HflC (stomatin/prohibitin superfamily)